MSHPPAQEDPALWLQLIRSRRIGPVTFHRLLADHGGVEAALAAAVTGLEALVAAAMVVAGSEVEAMVEADLEAATAVEA